MMYSWLAHDINNMEKKIYGLYKAPQPARHGGRPPQVSSFICHIHDYTEIV